MFNLIYPLPCRLSRVHNGHFEAVRSTKCAARLVRPLRCRCHAESSLARSARCVADGGIPSSSLLGALSLQLQLLRPPLRWRCFTLFLPYTQILAVKSYSGCFMLACHHTYCTMYRVLSGFDALIERSVEEHLLRLTGISEANGMISCMGDRKYSQEWKSIDKLCVW